MARRRVQRRQFAGSPIAHRHALVADNDGGIAGDELLTDQRQYATGQLVNTLSVVQLNDADHSDDLRGRGR